MKLNGDLLLNTIYPVGALYLTTNTINPSILFGGVWEQFSQGRCLVGVDTSQTEFNLIGKTGGDKLVKGIFGEPAVCGLPYGTTVSSPSYQGRVYVTETGISNEESIMVRAELSTLQPYICIYIWRRVS